MVIGGDLGRIPWPPTGASGTKEPSVTAEGCADCAFPAQAIPASIEAAIHFCNLTPVKTNREEYGFALFSPAVRPSQRKSHAMASV
jgi:hypothetical protein